jgi:hypothetical protein
MLSSGSKKLLCGGELELEASKSSKALSSQGMRHIPMYSDGGGPISTSTFAYSRPWSFAGDVGGLTCI